MRHTRGQRAAGGRVRRWGALGGLLVIVLAMALSACGSSAQQAQAMASKARLDGELRHASAALGVPSAMLQPIERQEQRVSAGAGGWSYDYSSAASNYALLYTQLLGIEQTSAQTLSTQAQADLDAFSQILQQRRGQGFVEADVYQGRLERAIQQLATARVPGDFLRVDSFVRAQTEALQSMWPAYQEMGSYQTVLQALGATGINTSLAQTMYDQDVQAFRQAGSGDFYGRLQQVIAGQITQLMADQSEAMPYIGQSLVQSLGARINLLASYGEDTSSFEQLYQQDARDLSGAHQLSDYLALAQDINRTVGEMSLPLARGQARHDLAVYTALVTYAYDTLTTPSPFDNKRYPVAYEYANAPTNGLGDVTNTFNQAQTINDYDAVDADILELTAGLRAEIDDLRDPTPHWLPHKTDLELLQQFGVMGQRVLVVSLREQTLRAYQDGKLVYWTYVTTGRPELPSPPGLHYAIYKVTNTVFTSAEPKGSPFWYAPTPIHYAMLYANYGFFVHDAWWRSEFGPGTNLPHWDPAAFNGGSHGCVNVPEDNMLWLYTWTPTGAPIILY